ncbi:MAG: aconitate hydratase [Candidatus Omnitrophica bacterium]|nr:aconitate hydratase [Candidatus Omnitrophota bacterium]
MPRNIAQKLIADHLLEGDMEPGEEIGIRIDQTLTQDATGTLVMLELEAMGVDRVKTERSVQYVDHNLLQEDNKNPDDHLFLKSACERFGLWFCPPGTGVSHPVHQERFGIPGKTLLGSDSHTPAGGAIGMLAIGAGGMEVAMAMAGYPFYLPMPKVWGVKLTGELTPGVSAKDIILEMLRRHTVKGGVGSVIEYHGDGLDRLSAMDRHVIANMGTELGATSTVFPSDQEVRRFLRSQGRENDWAALEADGGCEYDLEDEIDLSALEPLMALPSSPDNVVPVSDKLGETIYQAYIGSSANPGFRDFAIAAEMVKGKTIPSHVSFDINPTSRQILQQLIKTGHWSHLLEAGARFHQTGCNGCIGMGQAPATGKLSLRTVPRNFPGRSGTKDDQVCLVSPETAAASALAGEIADPRSILKTPIEINEPEEPLGLVLIQPPLPEEEAHRLELEKGPNISTIPKFDALPDTLEVPVLLVAEDNISTDEILPAGADVLPLRSNIPAISKHAFKAVHPGYAEEAELLRDAGGHVIIGGENYGQGSSREHAALAPRYLGLRVVIAKSFARIHAQNLVNFGVLPLRFQEDKPEIKAGTKLKLTNLREQIQSHSELEVELRDQGIQFRVTHTLSPRQVEVLLKGGLANWVRDRQPTAA